MFPHDKLDLDLTWAEYEVRELTKFIIF